MDSNSEKVIKDDIKAITSDGPLPPGILLNNRYKIEKLLKSGGMGAVYKTVDTKFNSLCAVKELLPSYSSTEEQKEAAEWFEREAKLLAGLYHPGLPRVFDYFVIDKIYYLIMDFVDGEDLFSILEREGKPGLPQEKVLEWSKEVLKVLDYLHSQTPPVLYRDMKPANIMLGTDGRIFLVDFGIAKVIRDQKTQTVIGTEGYASLEQCRGKAEIRSDIYSLGATMHHLLTGEAPLPFRFEDLRKMVPGISRTLSVAVMKALEKDGKDRFSSAKEMLQALDIKIEKKLCKASITSLNTGSGKWIAQYTETEANLRSIHFLDENIGWAVGYGKFFDGVLLNTVNGGKIWSIKRKGGFSKVQFTSQKEGFLAGGGLLGGVLLYTEDGGEKWMRRNPGLIIPLLNDLFFINPSTGWLVGDNGFICRTSDGGRTWKKQQTTTFYDLYGVHFLDCHKGSICGSNGLILYTEDGGINWERHHSNTKVTLRDIFIISDKNSFSAGEMGTILYNKGKTFGELLDERKGKSNINSCTDGKYGWRKNDKNLFLSSGSRVFPDLNALHFIDEQNGWIVGQKGIILYTSDGGESWNKIEGVTSENLFDVYFTDSNNGWAVGDRGTILKYTE